VTPDGSRRYEAFKKQIYAFDSVGNAALCLVNNINASNILRTLKTHGVNFK
jgi:hypothetical protein